LESRKDRNRLDDPISFLTANEEKLIVLDEIHRLPELFQELRGIIDEGRRKGKRTNRFLILGSASMDLLRQSSESLAGRIAYIEMGPFHALEIPEKTELITLWVRGGFPDSFLATNDSASAAWKEDFIRTYLEREIPLFGPRIPAETMERLWTMLAHNQGGILNASRLSASLSVSVQSVTRYIDLLCDLLLVRRLSPYLSNTGKRLVKSPKVYVRDSGLMHTLLSIGDYNTLAGHPSAGESWEGFVIENLLSVTPPRTLASFYRTSAGAEIALVLELPNGERWAVEIKLGMSPKPSRGFYQAVEDVRPNRSFTVYSGSERYFLKDGVEAVGLRDLMKELYEITNA
jgi:predicted AAA+ superfamily ATPase